MNNLIQFPGNQRRRRSSLAQLTDILREWSGGGAKRAQKPPLNRRETLADLARSLPWGRANTDTTQYGAPVRKRRESSADSGIKSMRSRRDSHNTELAKLWNRRDCPGDYIKDKDQVTIITATVTTESTRTVSNSTREYNEVDL